MVSEVNGTPLHVTVYDPKWLLPWQSHTALQKGREYVMQWYEKMAIVFILGEKGKVPSNVYVLLPYM